ncbi:hypothetical protein [Thiolapillus sp.]|uniref:hypothetical protein n=1 Tax=Thiolapillus sp. TaxID=2017437 RepID=UPI003AF6150A
MSNDKKHSDKASEYKTSIAMILLLALFWMLTGCSGTAATVRAKPYQAGERLFTHLESGKADDRFMEELYASRTWVPSGELTIDPIELGKNAKIPIQKEKAAGAGARGCAPFPGIKDMADRTCGTYRRCGLLHFQD